MFHIKIGQNVIFRVVKKNPFPPLPPNSWCFLWKIWIFSSKISKICRTVFEYRAEIAILKFWPSKLLLLQKHSRIPNFFLKSPWNHPLTPGVDTRDWPQVAPGHSGALRGTPGHSGALRGTPGHSGALRGTPGHSGALRGTPGHSGALRGTPGHSGALRGTPGHSGALRGTPGLRRS